MHSHSEWNWACPTFVKCLVRSQREGREDWCRGWLEWYKIRREWQNCFHRRRNYRESSYQIILIILKGQTHKAAQAARSQLYPFSKLYIVLPQPQSNFTRSFSQPKKPLDLDVSFVLKLNTHTHLKNAQSYIFDWNFKISAMISKCSTSLLIFISKLVLYKMQYY